MSCRVLSSLLTHIEKRIVVSTDKMVTPITVASCSTQSIDSDKMVKPITAASCSTQSIDRVKPETRPTVAVYLDELLTIKV